MDDRKFKEMDQSLMKKTEDLRQRKISEGILRGFAASVERRIEARKEAAHRPAARLVWAPALVMASFALFVVLKTPIQTGWQIPGQAPSLELAQMVSDEDIQDELALLIELGELEEGADSDLLGAEEELLAADMELSQKTGLTSAMA
jgi:hypothetical protein